MDKSVSAVNGASTASVGGTFGGSSGQVLYTSALFCKDLLDCIKYARESLTANNEMNAIMAELGRAQLKDQLESKGNYWTAQSNLSYIDASRSFGQAVAAGGKMGVSAAAAKAYSDPALTEMESKMNTLQELHTSSFQQTNVGEGVGFGRPTNSSEMLRAMGYKAMSESTFSDTLKNNPSQKWIFDKNTIRQAQGGEGGYSFEEMLASADGESLQSFREGIRNAASDLMRTRSAMMDEIKNHTDKWSFNIDAMSALGNGGVDTGKAAITAQAGRYDRDQTAAAAYKQTADSLQAQVRQAWETSKEGQQAAAQMLRLLNPSDRG